MAQHRERTILRKKSISLRADKLFVPENYVQDKIKMSHSTLERMAKSQFLYHHLLGLVEKQVKASKVVYDIGTQISCTLGTIGQLYPGDLGVVLADISAHTREIDRSIQSWSESLYNDFYVPLSESMDSHLKEIHEKQKTTKASGTLLNKEMALAEKALKKVAKLGQIELIEAMKEFNQKRDEIDKKKADVLYDVLFFERARFRFLIGNFLKPLQAQVLLGQNMNIVCSDICRWGALCEDENVLSEVQIQALVTASEQTFKQLIKSGGDNLNGSSEGSSKDGNLVVLYKTTSLSLKNLDELSGPDDLPTSATRRQIRPSKYEPLSKMRSVSYHSLDRGTLEALISPRGKTRQFEEQKENISPDSIDDMLSPTKPFERSNGTIQHSKSESSLQRSFIYSSGVQDSCPTSPTPPLARSIPMPDPTPITSIPDVSHVPPPPPPPPSLCASSSIPPSSCPPPPPPPPPPPSTKPKPPPASVKPNKSISPLPTVPPPPPTISQPLPLPLVPSSEHPTTSHPTLHRTLSKPPPPLAPRPSLPHPNIATTAASISKAPLPPPPPPLSARSLNSTTGGGINDEWD